MNPNKFHAIRALHVFRNVVEELSTRGALPLHSYAQRKLGLILLESAANVAHAAYELYYDADAQGERCAALETALRKADELYCSHVTADYRPYQILLENQIVLTQPPGPDFAGADVIPGTDADDSVETAAWLALSVLLADVEQTVAFGLSTEDDPAELLLLFVSLQLPAALVRCAFEALDGEDEDGLDVADAIDKYNALRKQAVRIRRGLPIPLPVLEYPAMPTIMF